MKTPESYIKDDIKAYLKKIGAYFFMPVQTGYGKPTLDFLVCLNGRFIGIETKREGKYATARQDETIKEIRHAMGYAFVVHSLDELKPLLAHAARE